MTQKIDATRQINTIIGPAANILTLTNAAAATLALNITAAKTLTLTATDNYALTIPATGTAALLAIANIFTAKQTIVLTGVAGHLVLKNANAGTEQTRIELWNDLTTTSITGGALFYTSSTYGGVGHLYNSAIGFWNYRAGPIIFATTGLERLTILAGGNVGIGTVNPYNLLQIAGIVKISETGDQTARLALGNGNDATTWIGIYRGGLGVITAGAYLNLAGYDGVVITASNAQMGSQVTRLTIPTSAAAILYLDTATNNVPLVLLDLNAYVTGGSAFAAGGGVAFTMTAETATSGTSQLQAKIAASWIDATNATRKAKLSLSAYDTAARLGMEIEASGTAAMLAFYGGTTVVRGAALTAQLTTITHTAPGTPDYAIQDLTQTTPWGFADHDEGNSVLKVIANLQVRVAELEARLGSATGVNLFA